MVLGLLANGLTLEEIIRDYYDHVTKDDILACIRYAQAHVTIPLSEQHQLPLNGRLKSVTSSASVCSSGSL
jgi:hypothetical protein